MSKVLVHGNPETSDIWRRLITELNEHGVDDIVVVSPPGFGAPAPEGWSAVPGSYAEWLTHEVETIADERGSPVDLLGHDWGAGHVFAVAADRPDLIRSWTADVGGLLHPSYVWHDMAQSWQTPGVGEEVIGAMLAMSTTQRTEVYEGLGLPTDIARPMAAAFDETMGSCILELYRGAVPPALRDLADRLASAEPRPALIIDATEDVYVGSDLVPDVADRFGADVLTLDGHGHWWMVSAPAAAAAGIAAFWSRLDD